MELLISVFNLQVSLSLLCISVALYVWYFVQKKFSYWDKRGVPEISILTCLPNFIVQLLQIKRFSTIVSDYYRATEGHNFVGIYQGLRPAIMLRDPTMVNDWIVKGFSNFHDRNSPPDEKARNLSGNLLSLTGERWHIVRAKVSPAFSSVKLNFMYDANRSYSEEAKIHLERLCSGKNEAIVHVDDFVSRYAMDVIGAWGLGGECNAIKDPQNCEIKKILDQFMRSSWRRSMELFLSMVHPNLARLFRSRCFSNISNFITSVTNQAIKTRHENGSSGKDFLQYLINVCRAETEGEHGQEEGENMLNGVPQPSKNEDSVFTENIVASTIFNMLAAGLHTVAATTTFCLYELAYHPEIQDRVFKEIQTVKNGSGDEIQFADLKKFPYLTQVISETLRKHPPGGLMVRKCAETFNVPNSSIVIEKGVDLLIPTIGFHHDSKYFPNPENFDPERFSAENIDRIVPGSYLPFGEGPRFCIANRMAIMNVKDMLITILSEYSLHPCSKTKNPLKFDRKTFTLSPEGAVWLCIKRRI